MEPTEPVPLAPTPEQIAADLRKLGYEAAAEDGWVTLSPASAEAVLAVLLSSLPSLRCP